MNQVKEPVLIIMAAGMGSRYGGLKQIDPVGSDGEIILDFSLYDAMLAGFKKAIFIIKRENEEDFRNLIDSRAGKHMEIAYAFQELTDIPAGYQVPEGRVKPWGTCHAVLAARKLVDGPFAVINADDYYGPGAFAAIYDYLATAKDDDKYRFCMVGYQVEKTLTENGYVARGVCEEKDGYLADIVERTKIGFAGRDGQPGKQSGAESQTAQGGFAENASAGGTCSVVFSEDDGKSWQSLSAGTTVSMNFWGFTAGMMKEMEAGLPAFLDKTLAENPIKGEYLLPRAVDQLIKSGRATVKVLRSADQWYGVTYKEDKEGVVNALQSMKDKGIYPEKLWK